VFVARATVPAVFVNDAGALTGAWLGGTMQSTLPVDAWLSATSRALATRGVQVTGAGLIALNGFSDAATSPPDAAPQDPRLVRELAHAMYMTLQQGNQAPAWVPAATRWADPHGDIDPNVRIPDELGLLPHKDVVALCFANSIDSQACAYVPSRGSEQQAVVWRIGAVRADPPADVHYQEYAAEFVAGCVNAVAWSGRGLVPFTQDELEREMDRLSQRQGRADVEAVVDLPLLGSRRMRNTCFVKVETAAEDGKAPRNITPVMASHLWRLAVFVYRVAEAFGCHVPWYAPGRGGVRLAELVHEVCRLWDVMEEGDWSKWDGHHNASNASAEYLFFRLAFPDHQDAIDVLWREMVESYGLTTGGVFFVAGWSKLSGDGNTTFGNTFGNALIKYCANRVAGLTPDEAWSCIGIVGGDDSLTPGVCAPQIMVRTAQAFGHVYESSVGPTDRGVSFFARVYPRPDLELGSYATWESTVARMGVVIQRAGENHAQCVVDKMAGVLLDDAHTPFVGDVAAAVLRTYPDLIPRPYHEDAWYLATMNRSGGGPYPPYSDPSAVQAHILGRLSRYTPAQAEALMAFGETLRVTTGALRTSSRVPQVRATSTGPSKLYTYVRGTELYLATAPPPDIRGMRRSPPGGTWENLQLHAVGLRDVLSSLPAERLPHTVEIAPQRRLYLQRLAWEESGKSYPVSSAVEAAEYAPPTGTAPVLLPAVALVDARRPSHASTASAVPVRVCYECGEPGHVRRDCPARQRARAARSGAEGPTAATA